MSEFQPPDREEDRDAMAEAFFASKEVAGYAVLSRDELAERIDSQCKDAYAEGRKDEREDCMRLLNWAYGKLLYVRFSTQEDALMLDEIKLMQMGAQ